MSETPYINGGKAFDRQSNAEISSANNLTAYNTPTYVAP